LLQDSWALVAVRHEDLGPNSQCFTDMSKSRIIKPQEQLVPALKMLEQSDQPYSRHFWAYFCEASYYVKAQRRDHSDKFAPKAEKCRLIGYADLHGKIHWIWNPKIDTIVRASAVRFNEGPEFNLDDDVDTEYEAASTDTISEEEEDMVRSQQSITLIFPNGRKQQIEGHPDQHEHQQQD